MRSRKLTRRGPLSQIGKVIFRGFALFRNVGESPAPS
jgi:hypothetical protein